VPALLGEAGIWPARRRVPIELHHHVPSVAVGELMPLLFPCRERKASTDAKNRAERSAVGVDRKHRRGRHGISRHSTGWRRRRTCAGPPGRHSATPPRARVQRCRATRISQCARVRGPHQKRKQDERYSKRSAGLRVPRRQVAADVGPKSRRPSRLGASAERLDGPRSCGFREDQVFLAALSALRRDRSAKASTTVVAIIVISLADNRAIAGLPAPHHHATS